MLVLGMRQEYLLTSYVSTKAMNPSGNAIAKEMSAASSPSLASTAKTLNSGANLSRHLLDNSSRSYCTCVVLCVNNFLCNSTTPVNEVMNACACVPPTGMLNNLPARTLLVPSKPPIKIITQLHFIRKRYGLFN